MVLLVGIIVSVIRGKRVGNRAWLFGGVVAVYSLAWTIFYFARNEIPVPFGSDVCFDDWCATVEGVDTVKSLGIGPSEIRPNGIFFILHVKMSNHARGIAQKPSEPRIHIEDVDGNIWTSSAKGQRALESTDGKQNHIDERLEGGFLAASAPIISRHKQLKMYFYAFNNFYSLFLVAKRI